MLKRMLAELKSILYTNWMLWKHGGKQASYSAAVMANDEVEGIEQVGSEVFLPNIVALNHSDYAVDAVIYGYDIAAVNATFLHGIFLESLERKFSTSPTPIEHRAMIHAMAYYAKHMDTTFLQARDLILKTEEIRNSKTSTLPLWKALELGRQAYCDHGNQHLIAAHKYAAVLAANARNS